MSVNIPISANPSQVINAFDSVREAIRRAGQEGRAFRDLDLSHPELSDFSDDLRRMQGQLEDLMRVSQGATARSARRVFGMAPGGADPLNWDSHNSDWTRAFPDEAERRRLQARVQGYVTQGTSFAPPPPSGGSPPSPPASPPPQRPGNTREDYSNEAEDFAGGLPPFVRSMARSAAQGATFGLSLAGIGGIRSVIAKSYNSAVSEGGANDQLMRRLPELASDFDTLRASVRRASEGMGITYQEAQRMAGIFVRTAGDLRQGEQTGSAFSIEGWTRSAAGFGRSAGMDATTSAGMFARAGKFEDAEKFATLVGDAAARGFQTGNVERVMESILRYQESTSRILVSSGGNVEGFANMWASMNATGKPGMRGENADALIGSIDGAVRRGGLGGHASEAVTWRAFAKAGITDPYEMQYIQEGGMFAKVGKGTLYDAVSGEIDREYQGAPIRQRQAARARHFGISMHQVEEMDRLTPAAHGGIASLLGKYKIDASTVNPTAFMDLARLSASGDWAGGRDALLAREDVSKDEKALLNGARGERLEEVVTRLMASKGMGGTSATRHQDASVGLDNRMTEFGDLIVPPMTALKTGITDLADAIKHLGQLFGGSGNFMPGGGGGMPFLGGSGPADGGLAIPAAFRQIVGGRSGFSMGSGGPVNVAGSISIADRARILASATAGTMVPPELLDGVISQESQWRPDAQRKGGTDLGLGQITDSTAADPGYGLSPISREDRLDPEKAARWSARYLEARGRAAGLTRPEDWRDPAKVARALRGYNGGGDRDYPEHVFSHMRRGAAPRPHPTGGNAINASFDPLRVIHEDRHGNRLHEEELRVRPIGPPMAYGSA